MIVGSVAGSIYCGPSSSLPSPFFRRFPRLDPHPSNPRRNPLASHQYSMPLNCFLTRGLSLSLSLSFSLPPSTILFSNSISKSPLRKTQSADCVSDPPGENLVFDLARSWENFLVYAYETRGITRWCLNITNKREMFKFEKGLIMEWLFVWLYELCLSFFSFFLKLIVKNEAKLSNISYLSRYLLHLSICYNLYRFDKI